MQKSNTIDYFALKKALAPFFHFSFKAPSSRSKNKDFKSQQKSALTRAYEKIAPYLDEHLKLKTREVSFLVYPPRNKLSGVDGIRTNKGLVYKYRDAHLKKLKNTKNKWLIVVKPVIEQEGKKKIKRTDLFFPFPKKILYNSNEIERFVAMLVRKYKPDEVMWSYKDSKNKHQFDPARFDLYFGNETENEYGQVRELTDFILKKFKNLLSIDKKKFEKAKYNLIDSDTYQMLEYWEQNDFWAALNYRRNARRTDFTYNGVWFIYYV